MLKPLNFVAVAYDQRVLCASHKNRTQNRAQVKGIKVSRNSSYHINHSNKVVHLKWGVKRSLILPRSSCYKTRTCSLLSTPPAVLALGGHPRLGGRLLVGYTLRIQEPRTQSHSTKSPSPVRPSSQDPAMSTVLIPQGWRRSATPNPSLKSWSQEADSMP